MLHHAPQYITIALQLVAVGIALGRFGQLKKPDHYDIVDVLIGPALAVGLLWWGGFYEGVF